MTYPFYFKIKTFFDDDRAYFISGLGVAKDFADATSQLENAYGNELIAIEHLELCEENTFIYLPDEICRKFVNDIEYGDPVPESAERT